jgi:hypothetical protein
MIRKQDLVFVAAVVAIALVVAGGSVLAGEPAKKVTGSFSIFEPWDGGHREQTVSAQEGEGNRPSKGFFTDYVYGPDGNLRRIFEFTVRYVNVYAPNKARFAAVCTRDDNLLEPSCPKVVGYWYEWEVYDAGSPGSSGDTIDGRQASSEGQAALWVLNGRRLNALRTPTEGNLVVHSK